MTLHRRGRQLIEAAEGIGQVLIEGKAVAKVNYTLFVEMLETGAKSFGIPREIRLKHKSVTGKISVTDGSLNLPADAAGLAGPLLLVMQDGRRVDFFIDSNSTETNPVRQEYQIQGSGNRL
ncbi:MAG: hypothetical protein FJ004_00960 [Chloroflexi bacterium]|nr:hypothetical protein [Chloroflexota bacterium]